MMSLPTQIAHMCVPSKLLRSWLGMPLSCIQPDLVSNREKQVGVNYYSSADRIFKITSEIVNKVTLKLLWVHSSGSLKCCQSESLGEFLCFYGKQHESLGNTLPVVTG